MGEVHVTLVNDQLGGTLATDDRVMGLVITGGVDGYDMGEVMLITSLKEATNQGVSETGSPMLYRQIVEFYNEAGTGAKLYVLPVPNTVTLPMMCDHTESDYAVKLLDFADGAIKVLGIMTDDTQVYGGGLVQTNGLNADVYTAASNMALLAEDYFMAQKPFRAIIGGTSYTGVRAALTNITNGTTNDRTSIVIGDTVPGDGAAVGLTMGRLASIPVQRKISRVKDGALSNTTAYLASVSLADPAIAGDPAILHGKGFITFRKRIGKDGYYFTGDPTASATNRDYHNLCKGCTIDKAHRIAYTVFVEEIDDEIATVAGGKPEPSAATSLQEKIIKSFEQNMVALGNCAAAACDINLDQVVTSTNSLTIKPRIRPEGYLSDIYIELGFML